MSNASDFVITKAGKLRSYKGNEETVIVPEGVVEISAAAFGGNITGGPMTIKLPESVKKIDFNAFSWCMNLTDINIPEGVTHIGSGAFDRCESLKSIKIPGSLQKIENPFSFCKSLWEILVPDDAVVREKCWQAFSAENKLIYCFTNIRRGIALTAEENAFLKRSFNTAVEMAVTHQDAEGLAAAFATKKKVSLDVIDPLLERCADAQDIRAFLLEYKNKHYSGEAVTRHDESKQEKELDPAKRSVSDWRKIFKFPASPKDGTVTIDGYKSEDKVVVIPGKIGEYTVAKISGSAFKKAPITEVVIENGVTAIGVDAFLKCVHLKKLVLPETLISLGWCAFAGCVSLLEVKIPGNVREFSSGVFEGCTSLQKVTVAEGAVSIGDGAFMSCSALQDIYIPASVSSIGLGAFWGCANLTIHAPAGSYAEAYAKENNIPFVAE